MSQPRVAVVGGGIAGTAAALSLSRGGAAVTVLESRGRLGGAAYSFTRHGIRVDNGQHVFLRCCTAYQEFLDEIGAPDMVSMQPRLRIPVLGPDGRRAMLSRTELPAPLHLAGSLARYGFLGVRQRAAVVRAMTALRRIDFDDPAVDARGFGAWLDEHGQDEGAVDALWGLIIRPTLNLDPSAASLAQAAHVFQVGLLRERAAGDVAYARVPLSEIHDVAARRALSAAGVEVHLRRGATAITPSGTGFRIEVSGMPTLCADVVVLAVPPDRAASLLPGATGVSRESLLALGRSPIVNLHVVYDRKVLDEPFAAGVGTPVQWIFDRTKSSGLRGGGQYLAISLSAADAELNSSVDDLRARYLPALTDVLPRAAAASVEAFFVTREHSATFRAAPGARALRPGPRTALPGLVLAGSWTDTGWPATMESAVRSGRRAAEAALEGARRRPLRVPAPSTNGAAPEKITAGGRA
jgi:squalene-associated FAD-dependent desaturase